MRLLALLSSFRLPFLCSPFAIRSVLSHFLRAPFRITNVGNLSDIKRGERERKGKIKVGKRLEAVNKKIFCKLNQISNRAYL